MNNLDGQDLVLHKRRPLFCIATNEEWKKLCAQCKVHESCLYKYLTTITCLNQKLSPITDTIDHTIDQTYWDSNYSFIELHKSSWVNPYLFESFN